MQDSPNTLRLKTLMSTHGLTVASVGALVNRSPQTVYEWRSRNGADIPDGKLAELELKIIKQEHV